MIVTAQKKMMPASVLVKFSALERNRRRTIQGPMDEFSGTGDHAKRAVCEWCGRIPPDPNGKVRILTSHL